MALWTNNAEGGTSGVGVTTANSGGANGNAASAVQLGDGTSTMTWSDLSVTFGSLCYLCTPAASQNCNWQWDQTADVAMSIAWALQLTGTPASGQQFGFFLTSASGTICQLRFSASTQIQITNSSQTVVHTFTAAMSVGTVYYVAAKLHRTNQTVDVKLWSYSAGVFTVVEEANVTSVALGGTDCGRVRFGRGSTGANDPFRQDLLAMEPGRLDYIDPPATSQIVAIGPALETDTALTLGGLKSKALGQGTQTDEAQPLGRVKRRALGTAVETDAAQVMGRIKARALSIATEIGEALGLGRRKAQALGVAAEQDTALTVAQAAAAAPTPAERTYTVPAEGRTHTVEAEARTLTIPAESRVYTA